MKKNNMMPEQIALEIARRVACHGETVSNVVREMIAEGILEEPEDSFEIREIEHCAMFIAEHFFI